MPRKAAPKPRTLGQPQQTIHREGVVYYSQRHHVKDKSKAGYHLEWHRAHRRVEPSTIARLNRRLEDKLPGVRVKKVEQADLSGFTEREKKRINFVDVPDADDDVINYVDDYILSSNMPTDPEYIQMVYTPEGDIELWIKSPKPKARKSAQRGKRRRGGSNPYH